jgi:hypothetical protein
MPARRPPPLTLAAAGLFFHLHQRAACAAGAQEAVFNFVIFQADDVALLRGV